MDDIEQHYEKQQNLFKQQVDEQIKFAAKMRTYKFAAATEFAKENNKSKNNKTNNDQISKLPLMQEEQKMKFDGITVKRKPGTKVWWARINRKGKLYIVYGHTQIECYQNLKETIIEMYKQDYSKQHKTKKIKYTYTLREYFEYFIKTYKINTNKIKSGTIKDDQRVFKNFSEFYDKKIENIKESDVMTMINSCRGDRQKEKAYVLLRSIFKKAKSNDLIKTNPTEDITKPEYVAPEQQALTNEEQQRFLCQAQNYPNKIHGDFLSVCLLQGFTRGECWSITNEKIDFVNNTITIDECIKESEKDTDTKNRYRVRTMPLFEKTKNILTQYKNKSGRIFDIKPWIIYDDLKEICKLAKTPILKIQELRHTFITRCQEKQIPLYIIQQWVGHKKGSKVTTAVYTHKTNEVEQQYINLFNK